MFPHGHEAPSCRPVLGLISIVGVMDVVVCKCAKCDAVVGTLINLWLQLGKKYMTPVTHADDDAPLAVSTSGPARQGDADTLVGGW